jgi:hypothetical protein
MFPGLRQRIGTAIVDRIDLMVEFSTLGEYALADDLRPVAMHGERRHVEPARPSRRTRDDCDREPSLSCRPDDSARP